MSVQPAISKFESAVLEHLDAAYSLARWLMRNDQDAQDVVQDACMSALRAFDSFRGGDFRPWFLAIVRNTSFSLLRRRKSLSGSPPGRSVEVGEEIAADCRVYDPQAIAMRAADAERVRRAISELPEVLREAVMMVSYSIGESGVMLSSPYSVAFFAMMVMASLQCPGSN